jgi:hypothetical protein
MPVKKGLLFSINLIGGAGEVGSDVVGFQSRPDAAANAGAILWDGVFQVY